MKLTGELKNKVEKVETKEEMKDIIADVGMELNDDELEMVSGGRNLTYICPYCSTQIKVPKGMMSSTSAEHEKQCPENPNNYEEKPRSETPNFLEQLTKWWW